MRQVFLLHVIDSDVFHDFWAISTLLWLWDLLEIIIVLSVLKFFLEILEVSALLEVLSSAWVEMSKVVEELLSHGLTLGVSEVSSGERVIDDLHGFPVGLSLKKIIHHFLSSSVAVVHDISVEADEPNLLKHDLNLTCRVVIDHLGDLINSDSISLVVFALLLLKVVSDGINELSEILTNWKINKDILEKTNEIIRGKTTNTL